METIPLTHWGRVTHICVGKLTIIGSDNGLWPGWRQAIFWTNAGILLIGPLRTNLCEMLITRPQWVNSSPPSTAYMRQWTGSALVQTIIWTNAGLLLIGSLGTNFSEIWIKIQNFSFMKMHLKISSAKWRPCCRGRWVREEQPRRSWWLTKAPAGSHVDASCLFLRHN